MERKQAIINHPIAEDAHIEEEIERRDGAFRKIASWLLSLFRRTRSKDYKINVKL
jgi:hypothetical protein